ncbi:MAG: ASCH domain-containing protein [Bacilli bacterium]|nr:ASCH domain-containing protein [Bacilli bacterium]MDD4718853.1 ASCH domain-containing protein [Bacilli bacterium]
MKVISILEPWASLIKENIKCIETRSWKTNYRGELYIHASKRKITKNNCIEYEEQLSLLDNIDFKYGYIIAKCKLVDCKYMDKQLINDIKKNHNEYICGGYSIGRYAWILEDIEPLKKPIPAKGQLGIWNYEENK